MLNNLFNIKKNASYLDISRALRLRDRIYTTGTDLNAMDEEQFLFFAYYSKMIADVVIKFSTDDQKKFISHCAIHLM